MKGLLLFIALLPAVFAFSQDVEKVKTEGEITEITIHRGKKFRETALVKFKLEDGTEQIGNVDLFRIPFIGSLNSVGDVISITYNKDNPVLVETVFGNFLSSYGMYILIVLGIIFSIRPFLKKKKNINANA